MALARNNQEVERMIMPALTKAIDYVVQKIWNDNREIVRQVVYEAYQPSIYNRTNEFKEAWETETKSSGNKAQGTFKYAPDKMSIGDGQHSSVIDGGDVRPYLAEIIYNGLSGAIYQAGYAKNSPYFAGEAWVQKRNAWKMLTSKISISQIKKYFEEGMRQNGINFKRGKGAVKVTKYDE